MDKETLKDLKRRANDMAYTFNLGKNGITDSFVKSVEDYLEAHGLIKLKCTLASNKDELSNYAQEVAQKTDSSIVEVKGYTFVLYKE